MERLVDITGYANTYSDLCKMDAVEGEFYNVLEGYPFTTYRKTSAAEIGFQHEMTDVLGWYENKAELESNVMKPKNGDVYIVGSDSPYTRLKANVYGTSIEWCEDGEELKKILSHQKTNSPFVRGKIEPEEGIYYSVGKEAPFELYGMNSSWEPVGSFISLTAKSKNSLNVMSARPGEVACTEGLFYILDYNHNWNKIDIIEPIENVYKHTYKDRDTILRLREGRNAGILEVYSPRS